MGRLATITRRTFLIGSAAIAGGVAFGYYQYQKDLPNPLSGGDSETVFNPYLKITEDGITVIAPRAEMGQGIHSTLAALVAEELDVPWDQVSVEHGPASSTYYNGTVLALGLPFAEYQQSTTRDIAADVMTVMGKFLGVQLTGGSTSTIDAFDKMRMAGAAARETLIAAAAAKFGVSEGELRTENGTITGPEGKSFTYADLAEDAAKLAPPSQPRLKDPKNWRYLGKSMPRLDMLAKSNGTAQFGIDTRLDGMLYGAVRMNPHLGGKMKSFDASEAEKMPGVKKIVDMGGEGVAAIATNTWRAFKAVEAIEVEWDVAPYPSTTKEIFEQTAKAFGKAPNSTLRDDGDISNAFNDPERVIKAEYRVPHLAHSCMEPMNATALLKDGKLEIWTGNQAPTMIRDKAAELAGLKGADVTVHTPFMGGGFGRRAEFDASNQAVRLAIAMEGTPVKLTWTREEDTTHDFYRPAAIARMKGVPGETKPEALQIDIAAASVFQQQGQRALGVAAPGPDKLLVEAAFDQPYSIANYQVNGFIADVAVPIGSWRSVGNSHNAFFQECFLDELAAAKKLDPLKMRLNMMQAEHEPSFKVLQTVAEMANWDGSKIEGKGRGVAFCYSFGSPTAQIVEVSQVGEAIRIDKVWCAIDVGTALDPRNIEAQMMSGIIYGMSAAALGEITFDDGQVQQTNYTDYPALRMNNAPSVEVRVLQNNDHMGGAGEPGTPPSMPALANAVFDLTGKRIRELPLAKSVDFVS